MNSVRERFGDSYNYKPNTDESYILCLKEDKLINPAPLDFFIYDVEKDSVTYRGIFPGGSVEWIDNYRFKAEIIPGNISDVEFDPAVSGHIFIYDVKENKKIE